MWGDVIRYAEVTSTNALAKDQARRGVPEGSVVVAGYQSDGRGRHGRRWLAPPGKALLASFIVRPPAALARSAWLTLGGGIAAARAIRSVADLRPALKWPNDLLLDGRKVGGILTETSRLDDQHLAVIGIGLNVNQQVDDLDPEIAETATSLAIVAGREFATEELLAALSRELREVYAGLQDRRSSAIRQDWLELDQTVGRAVVVAAPDGDWHGRAAEVDEQGALWVEDTAGELRRVIAGDVTIRYQDDEGN